MAAYGGYQRTGFGAQGGEDGGGFVGGSQQGSQGGGQKVYADESLRPVTIKQLIDGGDEPYPGAEIKIDNMPLTQVTVVGQVRSISPQTTNITYRIDDGTGTMDVKKWVDAEKAGDMEPKFGLDSYVRVHGRLKNFNNKKHIGANFMRAVNDYNEVSYHMLESTYVHLCITKNMLSGPTGQEQKQANAGDGGDNMFVDGGAGSGGSSARVAACSRNAQIMYNFLNTTPGGNEGVHLNMIANGTGMSVRDVMAAADNLLENGLVYTTMDDETWAILDY
ncbi:replication factor A protein 2 [Rhypophila decipiens]|uniref:Replication factor A protein 2 n=1 Tax=Rhypophila decipiens TaxID=261697 RepID=A0AAN7B8L3_9PEZI|nr:replication factor A protein 2 [Rhypophila decipiens]